MNEPRNIFFIPLLAGILVLISLLTPATYLNFGYTNDYLWLFGFYILKDSILSINIHGFMYEILIPSFIVTLLLLASGVFLIFYAIKLRLGSVEFIYVRKISIVMAFIIITSEILWLIFIPMLFPTKEFLEPVLPGDIISFWRFNYTGFNQNWMHLVGFGIIGGFIASGFSFVSAGVCHHFSKEESAEIVEKIPELKEKALTPELITPISKVRFKYCPECGAKITYLNANFCINCGYAFQN